MNLGRVSGQVVRRFIRAFVFSTLCSLVGLVARADPVRVELALDSGWRTILLNTSDGSLSNSKHFEAEKLDDQRWTAVNVPHNWDDYYGFRQVKHGDLHGSAWYRKQFLCPRGGADQRFFLRFEGVGSYATIWVNGQRVGHHEGGLTSFMLDVTAAVHPGATNVVALRADHPMGIRDLPWVCGGCERAYGFSEGTQPFGIFRPVQLVVMSAVHVEPYGVHLWNDIDLSTSTHVETEIKNDDGKPRQFTLVTRLNDRAGLVVTEVRTETKLAAHETRLLRQELPAFSAPHLWSLKEPYLYLAETELAQSGKTVDRVETEYGFRSIHWPEVGAKDSRFLLNGEPQFINGIAEYEHLLGASFAFTPEQIKTRVHQIEAAGFNAFRDAHYPHNLRYQDYWAHDGLLWWPQFSTHIWFESPAFRANFKTLLRDWVKERRNNPAVILWGLQNESQLPTAFAEECSAIIRELDPTASIQRKITTCNGGTGTDWNVPQNWTGTYGGDPETYADDLRRQQLVGEYGAWRSLGLHTEGPFKAKGSLSEDRMSSLMETKIRLAESVRDEVAGHFAWLFSTHSNPGRNVGEQGEQLSDGIRELDQVGPANNKGLLTAWGEPLDVYYLYRSNYAPAATQPMVYIVSHSWPDRWTEPGKKSGLVVYSNCDEVELFNDLGERSLGRRTRKGRGTHFQWDNVEIDTNVLYAEGRVGGKVVAKDILLLHHLPAAPAFTRVHATEADVLVPLPGQHYLYRVNCGGPDYVDTHGNHWPGDRDYLPGDSWGGQSWATKFPYLPPDLASKRRLYEPISGTRDDALFQSFRYGREQLRYLFSVPNGEYQVELLFTEPWYGTGGGVDCSGWRLFDVSVNGQVLLKNLDIWKEVGHARALKKTLSTRVRNGRIELSFPATNSYQAVISAIAISSARPGLPRLTQPNALVRGISAATSEKKTYDFTSWLDTGDLLYLDGDDTITSVPPSLFESTRIQTSTTLRNLKQPWLTFTLAAEADVYVAHDRHITAKPSWLKAWDRTSETLSSRRITFDLYRRRLKAGATITLGANTDITSADEGAMYTVLLKRALPPAPPESIRNVTNADVSENGANPWLATGHLAVGQFQYTDRGTLFTVLPSILTDCDVLCPPSQARPDTRHSVTFSVNDHVEVYVALDARIIAPPPWMTDWLETNLTLTTSEDGGHRFKLYKTRATPGTRITLGENGNIPSGAPPAMYSVIVRPVRPAVTLEAAAAQLTNAVLNRVTPEASASAAVTTKAGVENSIEWTITVGVGDRYGLNFRYASAATTPIPAELTVTGADGHVFQTDRIQFNPTGASKSQAVFRTRTSTSINAGIYHVRLRVSGPEPLILSSLEIE